MSDMSIKLNSQLVVEEADSIFLEKLGMSAKEVRFKTIDELLDADVPWQAKEEFYKSAYKYLRHTSILKFCGRKQAFWLGYKFDVCSRRNDLSGLAIDLYEIPKDIELLSQSVFDDLHAIKQTQ